ncbi:MAG: hypothetical protein EX272_13970 [Chromatiales bacterium]|nr:MAG: hypothetical protein EX272_13970 [Chromatiales bacterium]
MRVFLISAAAISCLLVSPRAFSIEPLSAAQLQQACVEFRDKVDGPWSSLCVYYVKGFLDGAVATDKRVAENVAAEIEKEESFTERAIRTRVGNRLREFGPSVYAEFCVGQPDPIADVVLHVVEELDRYDDLEGLQAQKVVYASLRRHYPCKT